DMNRILGRFQLRQRQTSVIGEVRGGLATFLTMSYILFANAEILRAGGVPFPSSVACTALAAGVSCILMGFLANFPIALASGMGLNALVAYTIASKAGSWQTAMGLIVLDGLLTLALVLAGLREAIMNAIPRDLRLATGAGIGLFIAFIGLANAKFVVATGDSSHPVAPGDWSDPKTIVARIGLRITATLISRRVTGARIAGIVVTTRVAVPLHGS